MQMLPKKKKTNGVMACETTGAEKQVLPIYIYTYIYTYMKRLVLTGEVKKGDRRVWKFTDSVPGIRFLT